MEEKTKFCKHCGEKIPEDAIICIKCGRQVEEFKSNKDNQQIIINNSNMNSNRNVNTNGFMGGRPKNKWVTFVLLLLLGFFGAHKFYEGKIGTGLLYLCTGGLCYIGVIIDFFAILNKPNPYYV